MSKKVIIVGGVAGGASTAARLRRLDETVEIIMFEKGEYIPAVIYINGKHQPSASNPGYKLSNGEM